MEGDILLENFFNFVCENGGFVKFPFLVKHSSPLASLETGQEAKEWLKPQAGFAFVKVDQNDEIAGVRIDLRKKMCQQYVVKGSCRRAQGKCKFWHICRSFIEGNCDGKCRRSHDFFDTDNREKIKRLALEKHSNGTVRDIVAWSLPQVCQLYLKSECKTGKCPYIHVCSKTVRGSSCKCTLSHNLTDSHNKNILKQYDLAPHQRMSVDFVRCSVLVPNKQKHFRKSNYSLIDDDTAVGKEVNASNTIPTVTAPPPSQGTVNVLCNAPTPVAASSNISSSSKHSQAKFVSHTQPAAEKKAGSLKKQKRGLKRSKTLTHQLEITTVVHPVVNNLANNSCSTSSKDSLECLNIPAEEKENLSDLSSDENNIANVCQNTLKKTENRKKTNSRTAEPTKGKETSKLCVYVVLKRFL